MLLRPWAPVIVAAGLAGCATASAPAVQVSDADRVRAAQATRPPSETAAREAIEARFQKSFPEAATATYAHGPLVNSVLVTGSGTKLAGWFMCGSVGTNDGPPRSYLAKFDPARGSDVVGGYLERGDSAVVARWCQQVRRNDLAAAPAAPADSPRQAAVPVETCRSGVVLCSFGRVFRVLARAFGLAGDDDPIPLATGVPVAPR